MMCNNLYLTEKLKNLPQPAHRVLPEQSEYKSEEVLLSHGKEHLNLLETSSPPGLLIEIFFFISLFVIL